MSKVVLSPDLSLEIKSKIVVKSQSRDVQSFLSPDLSLEIKSKIVVTNPVSVQKNVPCSQIISVQRSRKVQVVLQSSLTAECNGNVTPLSLNV